MNITDLNLEQLGTAGIFIVYLLWTVKGLKEDVTTWQQRSFDQLKESTTNDAENMRVLNRALDILSQRESQQ